MDRQTAEIVASLTIEGYADQAQKILRGARWEDFGESPPLDNLDPANVKKILIKHASDLGVEIVDSKRVSWWIDQAIATESEAAPDETDDIAVVAQLIEQLFGAIKPGDDQLDPRTIKRGGLQVANYALVKAIEFKGLQHPVFKRIQKEQ